MEWIKMGYTLLSQARKMLKKEPWDAHIANYVVRDCEAVKRAGLDDLAWSMHKGDPTVNDVEYLLERLEQFLNQQPQKSSDTKEGKDEAA